LDGALDDAERAELQRLRTEVARLHAGRWSWIRQPIRWRAGFAGALIALAALLAPLAVVARWAHAEVSDTDRYVATVAPLARDPAVQEAITNRITFEVLTRVDVTSLVQRALDALAAQLPPGLVADGLPALATPIASGIQSFIHEAVGRIVHSEQFAAAWDQANRAAHEQLVNALTGAQDSAVRIEGDAVQVNLAPLVAAVKRDLVTRGFQLAARIPTVDASFVIFESDQVPRVQRAFALLSRMATWLPLLALAAAGAGIYLSANRRRALVYAALAIAGAMLLLTAALAIARPQYLRALPPRVSRDAAAAVFDALCRPMRSSARAVLVAALAVAAGGALAGPSAPARAVRSTAERVPGWLGALLRRGRETFTRTG
jgi:hypothetical protein